MFDLGYLLVLCRSSMAARDLSEVGALVYHVANREPLTGARSLLPRCNAHSSSAQPISPMQAAASDREDRLAQHEKRSSVSSTRTPNGSKRESRTDRSPSCECEVAGRQGAICLSSNANPKMIDNPPNSLTSTCLPAIPGALA